MTRSALRALAPTLALALCLAIPAWAQDADLLAIPENLTRTLPPNQSSGKPPPPTDEAPGLPDNVPNYRSELRSIVGELSTYGHGRNRDFLLLVRGGADLVTKAAREAAWEALSDKSTTATLPVGALQRAYIRAVDGIVLDGLYCADDKPAAVEIRKARLDQLKPMVELGRRILSIDTCSGADASRQAVTDKVLQFTAADRRLQAIPTRPPRENAEMQVSLAVARNLLVNLRSEPLDTKAEWLAKLRKSNHDLIIIDAFHRGSEPLTRAEVEALKFKHLGSRRLVLAAMSLTIANEDRFYWKKEWRPGNPAWLIRRLGDSGDWQVDYWHADWKQVLGQYFKGLVDLGFDGVMLEGLDVYQQLESDNPITDEERKAKAEAEKAAREKAKALARAAAEKRAQPAAAKPMIGEEVDPNKPAGAEPAKTPDKAAAKLPAKPGDRPGPDKPNPNGPGPRPPVPPKP